MARTVFATIDIDAALQQGAERELYATVQAEAGQISFNGFGQQPVFVAGPLQMTDFRAEPTGFFELLLHVGNLVGWPQSDYPQEEQAVIAEFSNSEVRVLGRLLGTCMVRSGEGDPIRVIDVDSDERCAPLMSHL